MGSEMCIRDRYLIVDGAEPAIEEIELAGIGDARPTPEIREALAAADLIVVGPSNPVISIGPIVAVPGMRELIGASPAPVVAVSPFVAGEVVKGPTEKFMAASGHEASVAGVAAAYEGLIDALVIDADDPAADPAGVTTTRLPTLMADAESRVEVARAVVAFASGLRS